MVVLTSRAPGNAYSRNRLEETDGGWPTHGPRIIGPGTERLQGSTESPSTDLHRPQPVWTAGVEPQGVSCRFQDGRADERESSLPAPGDLEQWVGRYRVAWKGEIRECVVRVDQDHLLIDGLLWPANRLLWKTGNIFDAESWPFEVVIESAAAGGIGRLAVRGPTCLTP